MQIVAVRLLSSLTLLYVMATVYAESSDSQSALEAAINRVENDDTEKRGWNELSGMWGKRGWNNLQGMWGKRGWNNLQGMWGKRGWNNLQNVWGKRNNWNNLQGMWGKRGWNNLQGVWGKRDGTTSDKKSDWNKLNGMWGKRSATFGWRREPSSWDQYSIEEDPEIMKQMML